MTDMGMRMLIAVERLMGRGGTYHMTSMEIARLNITSPYKDLNIITAIK